ncbi:MAG: efflux RND transporter periplasmic adaptor subunit [Bacteroidales bacterium]
MKKLYLVFSAIAFVALGACSKATKKIELKSNNMLSDVSTILAYESDITREVSLTGKVITDPDKTVSYVPLTGGVVVKTFFAIGDKVEKGQTLVEFRSSELSTLQADLVALQGELIVAERELQTAQGLYADRIMSEKEYIEAKNKVKQVKASLRKTESDMAVYGVSCDNGTFVVKAPMSGYVIAKSASAGSTVSSDSDPLFTIADLNTVWIIANIYAGNIQYAREGTAAEIYSVSYPDQTFAGKINHVSHVFDPEDKTLKARIVLPNGELMLKPEMSVVVKLKDQSDRKAVTIPAEAVIFDNNKHYVVTYNDQKPAIHEVIIDEINGPACYLLAGVNKGDAVISKNQLLIYEALKKI